MARYYFHVRQDERIFADPQGIELSDLEHARRRAREDANMIVEQHLLDGGLDDQWMQVEDASGTVLAIVPFGTALH